MSKLNIYRILRDHFDSQLSSFWDWCVFIIFPALLAVGIAYAGVFISNDFIGIAIAALSIFVGLLLNMIVLLFDIMNRKKTRALKVALLQEVLANICFTIFLSVLTILVILPTMIGPCYKSILYVFNGVSYFCLILFLLNLIMILKRVYMLFFDEGEVVKKKK